MKFIGPRPEVIRLMGVKERARAFMRERGVPVLPGSPGVLKSPEEALELARRDRLSVILKASAGGGGRGMRIVDTAPRNCPACWRRRRTKPARRSASATCTWRSSSSAPRHIEFQVLADQHGNVEVLGERECSIQRRHQKLIEESPSPPSVTRSCASALSTSLRKAHEGHRLHQRRHGRVPDGRERASCTSSK